MFYKWGGSDILSISTFNHYSRILKVVAVILLQKKYGIIWELFPKGGGVGSPIPKTLSKFTNIVLEMFLKNDFFLSDVWEKFPNNIVFFLRAYLKYELRKLTL